MSLARVIAAAALLPGLAAAAGPGAVAKVPPTGVRTCLALDAKLDDWPTPQACADTGPLALVPKQDGLQGAGLPAYAALPGQPLTACVRDRVSGLVWEGKPDSGRAPWPVSYRGPERFATYATDAYGPLNAPAADSRGHSDAYSHLGDGRPGDALAYVAQVNAMRLCGYADWRLPTAAELHGLLDLGKERVPEARPTQALADQALIDARWFPNTVPGFYLASELHDRHTVWCVNFLHGTVLDCDRDMARKPPPLFVRLVRGPEAPAAGRWREVPDERGVPGGVVEDLHTGLAWRRCEEPQVWNGRRCTWSAGRYDFVQALQRAGEQRGWRLPTIKEVNSLAERGLEQFELPPTGFPPADKDARHVGYWSSTVCDARPATPTARASISGWVLADGGNIYCEARPRRYAVRLVRE